MTSENVEPIVSRTTSDDGGTVLRLEFQFAFPPVVLWKHLTEADKLLYWFPCELEFEPRKDEEILFRYADQKPLRGVVLEAERPSVLAYTWEKDTLRWELTRTGDNGTSLVLLLTPGSPRHSATMAAGWHLTIAGLDDFLNKRDLGQDPALWDVYVDRYREQFAD
ncbi:SRPBCC domain-containing protein [Arthrobacter sp. RIT-PI-e]|uniref:SRPBCC domain-containing protein n=1 Tax=Arthrobacter sp. RIT-PI-e TaxID=1681197 RepID=UPI000675D68B|nr:SRPBCC domain-containing protein [Arthrobacter sp. RIT-PI-e]